MDKLPSFIKSVCPVNETRLNDDHWEAASSHYKNGRYRETIYALMDYVDPELRQKYSTDNGFSVPHGSVIVNIELDNDQFTVNSPFLNIADSKKVPLMRKLAEIKHHPLNLASIKLADEKAHFHFSCPLHNCEPHKTYNVLREICVFADMYDDEFIKKYNATHLQEPQITQLAGPLKEDASLAIKSILEEGMTYVDYYMNKRWAKHAWYMLNITLKRIDYYAQPQGFFKTELDRAIDLLYNKHMDFYDVLMKTKGQVQTFVKYPQESIKDALYGVNTFVPSKYKGSLDNIKENWQNTYEKVKQVISAGNYEEASLLLLSSFYNIFYYNYVGEEVSQPILKAIEEAQGSSWQAGSQILFTAMENLMEDNMDLFGMGNGMDLSKAMEQSMAQSMEMMQKMMKGFMTE